MIIEELVLHNFGPFRDEQRMVLAPPGKSKPVVLIGALNGSGKTSLLDAIHLVLYGKRAKCHKRGSLGYDVFLRRCIHRHAPPEEGAGLQLKFRHRVEGEDHVYRVMRWWKATGKGIEEHLEVVRNFYMDPAITEAWDEHIGGFMPQGIAPLFFFDGEKVEDLADLEKSGPLIATALNSLLGIELIEQLSRDLVVLERRTRKSTQPIAKQEEVARLELEAEQARDSVLTAKHKQAAANNELVVRQKAFFEASERFKKEGGGLFERRGELETKRKEIERELHKAKAELREMAASEAPLMLVTEQLDAVRKQAVTERKVTEARLLAGVLEKRDKALLAVAKKAGVNKVPLVKLDKHLAADRSRRRGKDKRDPYIELSSGGFELLNHARRAKGKVQRRVRVLLDTVDQFRAKAVDLDRQLQQVPDHDAIASLMLERERAHAELRVVEDQIEALKGELRTAENVEAEKQRNLSKALEVKVIGDFRLEDAGRLITHAGRARNTLGLFRETLIKMDSARIQELIGERFRHLVRKKSLFDTVEIHPPNFEVQLTNKQGQFIPPDGLSAGERQLLAVSILWGLALASGRTLPAIIDTPLGRMDSTHRQHLVERYFPKASHQVMLLSTDEEINERYYEQIKKRVGRSYLLEYDDKLEATTIKPGYFWS